MLLHESQKFVLLRTNGPRVRRNVRVAFAAITAVVGTIIKCAFRILTARRTLAAVAAAAAAAADAASAASSACMNLALLYTYFDG